jgi:hypothetical protein
MFSLPALLNFFIGIILGPVIFFFLANLIFFLKTGELRSSYTNSEIEQFITSSFSSQYQIEIIENKIRNFGEPSIIVFAHDKQVKNYCSELIKSIENGKKEKVLLPPIIKIFEKRSDLFFKLFPYLPPYKSVFELQLRTEENQNLFVLDKKIEDLDGNGNNEIRIKLMTTTCGSYGKIFHFIIGLTNDNYTILATLPDIAYFENQKPISENEMPSEYEIFNQAQNNGWEPKPIFEEKNVLNSAQKIKVRYATTDDYIEFKDLDDDGINELIIAKIIPGTGECHWCPHNWIVGVYKYRNGNFNIDNKFNSALLLVTKEKFNLSDIHGYKPLPINLFGLIPQYYDLLDDSNNFRYRERSVSKIFQIIKDYYHLK